MRQSRTILLMGATALVAAAAGFEARRGPAAQPAHAAPPPVAETVQRSSGSVDVASAALRNMDLHLARANLQPLVRIVQATGVVAFNDLRMAQLSPPARGRIQSIEVAVGQPVRAGQALALLDNFDLGDTRSHIAAAEAALVQAKAEASAARTIAQASWCASAGWHKANLSAGARRLLGPTPKCARGKRNFSSGRRPSSGKCRRGRGT
jgi:cobalt-zinc-cadmium efflux system membrane fusion protein